MSFPRNKPPRFAGARRWLVACCLLIPWPGFAAQQLTFSLERLTGEGFALRDVAFAVDLFSGALQGRVARLDAPASDLHWKDISLDCPQGELTPTRIGCRAGSLRFTSARLGRVSGEASFDYRIDSGEWQLHLRKLRLLSGRVDLRVSGGGDRPLQLRLGARRLSAKRLARLLPGKPLAISAGRLNLTLDYHARAARRRIESFITWSGLSFEQGDEILADALGGSLRLKLSGTQKRLRGSLAASLKAGEMLTPWAYLGVDKQPLEVSARLDLKPARRRLTVTRGRLRQGDIAIDLTAELDARAKRPLTRLVAQAARLPVKVLFENWLRPVLPDARLKPAGYASLKVELDKAGLRQISLRLTDGALRDGDGDAEHYRIDGLRAVLSWLRGQGGEMRLRWRDARLYRRVPIGAANIGLRISKKAIRAERSIRIPVSDGELVLDDLLITGLDKPIPDVSFNAVLTPISLARISKAFGWVPLKGALSAVIPGVRYADERLNIAGAWLIRAFDGSMLIRNLSLARPFGALPVLQADIQLKNLNLKELTDTFSFGKITGTLDGYIRGLRLEGWKPVAFDARFYTPDDDPLPHRISQRAVDNISNLGGAGVSGALSRSFLRFVEDFGYAKLGIGCRLHDGVCDMLGAEDSPQGYYLLKGSGIPRIDIKGFNRQADWELLVAKLIEISKGQGMPTIQ